MTHRIQWLALLTMTALFALATPGLAEDVERQFETYDELRLAVRELWKGEQPKESIRLFQTGLRLFPDRSFEITSSLINMNLSTGRVEDCFELFTQGVLIHRYETIPELGHWYPEDFAARLDAAIAHIFSPGTPTEGKEVNTGGTANERQIHY